MEEDVIFYENQKFRQWWLWCGFLFFFIIQIYGLIQQIIFDKPFGNNPASNTTFVIIIIVYIGFIFFFYTINFSTKILKDKEDIFIRYFPLQISYHKIHIKDIKKSYVRTYNPIIDYGGWGIRYGLRSSGLCYNVSGNKGLQLELKNGKLILLGSQKPDELKNILD
jgi:hypothetical protein